jgi:hypothetical protein
MMTLPIKRFPKEQRRQIIERRLHDSNNGLGFISAVDAALKLGIPIPQKRKVSPEETGNKRKRSNNDGCI